MSRTIRLIEARLAAEWIWRQERRFRFLKKPRYRPGRWEFPHWKMSLVGWYADAFRYFRDRTRPVVPFSWAGERWYAGFHPDRTIMFWSIDRPGITQIHWDDPARPIIVHEPDRHGPNKGGDPIRSPRFPAPLHRRHLNAWAEDDKLKRKEG